MFDILLQQALPMILFLQLFFSLQIRDGDGITDYLDSDSDVGCDAIEGSENVKYNQIHALIFL